LELEYKEIKKMAIDWPEGPGAEHTLAEDSATFNSSILISLFSDCCSASAKVGNSIPYLSVKIF